MLRHLALRIGLMAMVFAASTSATAQSADFRTVVGNRTYVEGRYVDDQLAYIQTTLDRMRQQCMASPTCARSSQAGDLYSVSVRVQSLRGQMGYVGAAADGNCLYQPRPGTKADAMDDDSFALLAQRVSSMGIASNKIDILRTAARTHWFSSQHVVTLLSSFGFSPDRLNALQYLAPKITDPENGLSIEDLFVSDSDKNKVREAFADASACPGTPYEERMRNVARMPLVRPTAAMPRVTTDY